MGRAAARGAPGDERLSGVRPWVVVYGRAARALSSVLALAVACYVATASPGAAQSPRSRPPIVVWLTAGLGGALEAMQRSFRDFNASQQTHRAEMVLLPEGTYADAVRAAGRAGELPCLLFIDGPLIPHFAWLGYLQPIDPFVPKALRADVLPSLIAQGSYRDRLYALGIFDSGLGIHANRRLLRAAGVRVPTVDRPWTLAEFEDALARLGTVPGVRYALDLKINYGRGEYFTYAYSPILQSMGGDLIERRTYRRSRGVLDGPRSIAAM